MYINKDIPLNILTGIFIYLLLNYSIFLFDKEIVYRFSHEDGVIEYLGALYFFISAILFFILFKLSRKGNDFGRIRTKKNIFYLLLGMAFLVASSEEISWGQRIFNIQTPKVLEEINVQKETTIHNLEIFQKVRKEGQEPFFSLTNLNTWFTAFSLGFCFFIPLLYKMSAKVSEQLIRIRLPIVPIEIGSFFMMTYFLFIAVKFYAQDWAMGHAASEIRESVWAFLYLTIAVFWIKKRKMEETLTTHPGKSVTLKTCMPYHS